MLTIDLNEIDDGQPNWLTADAERRAAERKAQAKRDIAERMRERARRDNQARKQAREAADKDFDPAQPRDDHGRWTDGAGSSSSGNPGDFSSANTDPKLVETWRYNGEAPTWINPTGTHEWSMHEEGLYEKEKIKNDIRVLDKDLDDAKAGTAAVYKKFIQANAGVAANINKLANASGKLQNELNVLWDNETQMVDRGLKLDDPERAANLKAMQELADKHAEASKKEVAARLMAKNKARAAYNKAARAQVQAPIKFKVEEYHSDIGVSIEAGKAMQFLQGTLAASHPDIESRSGSPDFVIPIKLVADNEKQRAYHQAGVVVVPKNTNANTIVHEIGHAIEWRYPGVARAARAFLMKRVGDEAKVDMAGQFPGHGYDPGETGRKDEFLKAMASGDPSHAYYTGKHYESGATEIMSMGLENLYLDPVNFAKRDPEFFNFVSAVMRGDIR
jgi:hypothetical protein